MRRQLHRRWVGMVSGLALLLGVWGAAPVLAAPDHAGATAAGETPEAYSAIQVVAAVLKLSDDQARTVAQILTAKAESIRPVAEQIQQHEQEIATLLGGDNPDPAQLGRLLIETRALQARVQTISAASAAQFVSVLSDPQKQTLGQIRQASQVCPVVPAFTAVGVL
ncbi:MAG TPA: periplasmic heavy metal sensor [Thermoanaerobaculia bacterium]|nr:periplasmic heavy metal sensor [Thermoanaerobaculia bacterium]